ncbi:MAG: DHH family phosphoesterase, partial [Candidatus Thermoplasmatota archaeon]
LASVGYYTQGPEKAVNAALTGFTKELSEEVKNLETKRKLKFRELQEKLQIKQSKEFSWFHSASHLSEFGVKVIGSFCSYLSFQPYRFGIKKPLLGFMNMSRDVPGLGKLKHDYVKISARLPKGIKSKINLGLLLQKACADFNGIGEGHAMAASGVILKGKEEEFIAKLDELAST